MAICPECEQHYGEEISECLQCGSDLVEKMPQISRSNPEWVQLNIPGPVFGEMVKEALSGEDIPSLLIKDFMSSAYGAMSTGLPGHNCALLVPKALYPQAEKIVHAMFRDFGES